MALLLHLTPHVHLFRRSEASSGDLLILFFLPVWLRGCGNAKSYDHFGKQLGSFL